MALGNRDTQTDRSARPLTLALTLLAAVALPIAAIADEVLSTRTMPVNGRQIQEIRLSETPDTRNLHVLVLTNGPTAGTTTLLTAVAPPAAWVDPAIPPPVFNTVLAAATAFSIGGGCRRGNQVDFPYIDGFQAKLLRIIGDTATPMRVLPFDTDQYDSADCVTSLDGTRTFLIYSNRSRNRLAILVDTGGPTDLNVPLVTFSSVKPPSLGGLRPAISTLPGKPLSFSMLYMETNGQSRWREYDTKALNVDFNCLAGAQTPPPSGFTIPRGARVVGNLVQADFDSNGFWDFAAIDRLTGPCSTTPPYTTVGPVAGDGYNWSEAATAVTLHSRQVQFLAGQQVSVSPGGAAVVSPGPNPGDGGPNAACGTAHTESIDAYVVTSSFNAADLQWFLMLQPSNAIEFPEVDEIFRSSAEDLSKITNFGCGSSLLLYL